MGDWASECESSDVLMRTQLKRLQALDPSNALLAYRLNINPDPFHGDDEAAKQALKDRFWQRSNPWQKERGVIVVTVVYTNYMFALRKEADRIEREKAATVPA